MIHLLNRWVAGQLEVLNLGFEADFSIVNSSEVIQSEPFSDWVTTLLKWSALEFRSLKRLRDHDQHLNLWTFRFYFSI